MAEPGPSQATDGLDDIDTDTAPLTKKGYIADCVNLLHHCHRYTQLGKPYPEGVNIGVIRAADGVRRLQSNTEISRYENTFKESHFDSNGYRDPGPEFVTAIANNIRLGPGTPDSALERLLAPLLNQPQGRYRDADTEAMRLQMTGLQEQFNLQMTGLQEQFSLQMTGLQKQFSLQMTGLQEQISRLTDALGQSYQGRYGPQRESRSPNPESNRHTQRDQDVGQDLPRERNLSSAGTSYQGRYLITHLESLLTNFKREIISILLCTIMMFLFPSFGGNNT